MTTFEVKDARYGETTFTQVTRTYYKKVISIQDRAGQPLRTGVEYRSGTPVKQLTLLSLT